MLLKIMWGGYSDKGMKGNRNKCKFGEAVNKLKEKNEEKSIWGREKKKEKYTKKTSPTTERRKAVFSLLTTLRASSKSKIR